MVKPDEESRPFPIQTEHHLDSLGKWVNAKSGTIPWWLAEIAYGYYVELFGASQSLERLAERGGFGRKELLALLRRDKEELKKPW